MENKSYWVVARLADNVDINGILAKLPKGEYALPAFEDYDKAVEYSLDGKYEILEFKEQKDETI